MQDGEIILVHLRLGTALFDALPGRRRALRWTTPDRDGYAWRRSHIWKTAARFELTSHADHQAQAFQRRSDAHVGPAVRGKCVRSM
jgi:hypothetical protein